MHSLHLHGYGKEDIQEEKDEEEQWNFNLRLNASENYEDTEAVNKSVSGNEEFMMQEVSLEKENMKEDKKPVDTLEEYEVAATVPCEVFLQYESSITCNVSLRKHTQICFELQLDIVQSYNTSLEYLDISRILFELAHDVTTTSV